MAAISGAFLTTQRFHRDLSVVSLAYNGKTEELRQWIRRNDVRLTDDERLDLMSQGEQATVRAWKNAPSSAPVDHTAAVTAVFIDAWGTRSPELAAYCLDRAAAFDLTDAIHSIVRNGADRGWELSLDKALWRGVICINPKAVAVLLAYGANPNGAEGLDFAGETPLQAARDEVAEQRTPSPIAAGDPGTLRRAEHILRMLEHAARKRAVTRARLSTH